jgi:hypothetical protein
MSVPVTYSSIEWHALAALARRPELSLDDPDLPSRIFNAVGRAWMTSQQQITLDVAESDATLLLALSACLPDTEVLAVIAEAERIVREHSWRPRS